MKKMCHSHSLNIGPPNPIAAITNEYVQILHIFTTTFHIYIYASPILCT